MAAIVQALYVTSRQESGEKAKNKGMATLVYICKQKTDNFPRRSILKAFTSTLLAKTISCIHL